MASNNANGNGNPLNPDTIVCKCLDSAKDDKNTAESNKTSAETSQQSKQAAKGYKICCLDRAEETHDVYQDIMSCIALGNYKKIEIIQKNIDEYAKKDDEIEKLIKDSSKLLADLCTKLEEADKEACTMSTCVKNKILTKSSKSTEEERTQITKALKEITDKSKELVDKGQNAYESIVTIAGIQTFTNTASLKGYAAQLMDAIKKFKDCMSTNISSTAEEIIAARSDLNEIMEKLAELVCEGKYEGTIVQAMDAIKDFICERECDGECLDLCKEFEKCCKSDDDYYEKGKPKKMVDQN